MRGFFMQKEELDQIHRTILNELAKELDKKEEGIYTKVSSMYARDLSRKIVVLKTLLQGIELAGTDDEILKQYFELGKKSFETILGKSVTGTSLSNWISRLEETNPQLLSVKAPEDQTLAEFHLKQKKVAVLPLAIESVDLSQETVVSRSLSQSSEQYAVQSFIEDTSEMSTYEGEEEFDELWIQEIQSAKDLIVSSVDDESEMIVQIEESQSQKERDQYEPYQGVNTLNPAVEKRFEGADENENQQASKSSDMIRPRR